MSRAVVDASTTVALLLGEAHPDEMKILAGEVHAPALLDVEVTNVLRGLLRGARVHHALAEQVRGDLRHADIERHADAALVDRAWELRHVCTIYDGLYVALAEVLGAVLVTRDARLARGVADLIDVAVGPIP